MIESVKRFSKVVKYRLPRHKRHALENLKLHTRRMQKTHFSLIICAAVGGGMVENMKKARILMLVAGMAAGIIIFKAGMTAGAASSRPGTSGDPLITQSYLEQRLSEVTQSSYNKILLTKGKTISLDLGSEAILYSGSATVSGSKGLISLTDGKLNKSGSSLIAYSLYFSPDSTSGIISVSDCILYVNGGYTIK